MGTIAVATRLITLSGSDYGSQLKTMVTALVDLCGTLTLDTVSADTTAQYDATYKWSGFAGAEVRIYNQSGRTNVTFGVYDNGVLVQSNTNQYSTYTSAMNVISIKGTDWESWQLAAGNTIAGETAVVATDYFYPNKRILMAANKTTSTGWQPYAPFYSSAFYALNNGSPLLLNTSGVGPSPASPSISLACPLNFYNTIMGFSGFVGGIDNLYILQTGTQTMDTGTVEGRIQLDRHNFAGGGGTTGIAVRLS